MRLDLGIMAGENTKKFLVDLEGLVTRMERAAGIKPPKKAAAETEAEEEEESEEEEDDFAAKKKAGKKKGASFEDEEEEEKEDEDEEEEEEEEKPAKKTAGKKAPKLDLDDVNDACKDALERLGGTKKARTKVVAVLTDDFDCENGTVTELKAEQYADVIKAMGKLK